MAEHTNIAWTDSTFNPWIGCTKISPACDNCYAAALDKRTGGSHWGAGVERRRTGEANWRQPIKWNKNHEAFFKKHGRRQRVFCASMADVFDNEVNPQWRADLFSLIDETPHLDWLLLTKRIGNVSKMYAETPIYWHDGQLTVADLHEPMPNVWLGATICNQEEADRDIPKLLATPAAKRFLSIEPLLGEIDLQKITLRADGGLPTSLSKQLGDYVQPLSGNFTDSPRLDWVIVGGESGHGARPMHPDWARSLRDQCAAANVPFMFKQWGDFVSAAHHADENLLTESSLSGGWLEMNGDVSLGEKAMPYRTGAVHVFKTNKKLAGRLLDGLEHNGYPV